MYLLEPSYDTAVDLEYPYLARLRIRPLVLGSMRSGCHQKWEVLIATAIMVIARCELQEIR
jgi:hypothetical protein